MWDLSLGAAESGAEGDLSLKRLNLAMSACVAGPARRCGQRPWAQEMRVRDTSGLGIHQISRWCS